MLTKSGVKLLDFGLAKILAGETDPETSDAPTQQRDLTKEQAIIGTLQYMAPEQLEGGEADARTDLWAFGCVVYEMVTGKKVFEGKSQASLITAGKSTCGGSVITLSHDNRKGLAERSGPEMAPN